MGRLRKVSFPCKYCSKTFKSNTYLEKHLLSHSYTSSQRRNTRIRSNWCHACRQRFTHSEYKSHIMTEHQYDSRRKYIDDSDIESEEDMNLKICNNSEYYLPNKNIKQEINKNTSVKSPIKKALKKIQADPSCSNLKIKPELVGQPLSAIKSVSPKGKGGKVNPRSTFVVCNKCGMKCKNQRGLKIHFSTTHKRNSSSSKHESFEEVEIQEVHSKEVLSEKTQQYGNSFMSSTYNQPLIFQNSPSSLSESAQTGLIYNSLPIQAVMNNMTGSRSQTNFQFIPIFINQSSPVEAIPKFNQDSENYVKWVKKFIHKCKIHKYPLTPLMCKTLSYISAGITEALAYPTGSMNKRSNHFYFMKIKSLLSEIMVGQMKHSLDVVKKTTILLALR